MQGPLQDHCVCGGPWKHTPDHEAALTETTTKHTSDGGVVTETTKDIHGYYLAEELEALKPLLPFSAVKPEALLEYLAENSRFSVFPNVFSALRIYLTPPITKTYQNIPTIDHVTRQTKRFGCHRK